MHAHRTRCQVVYLCAAGAVGMANTSAPPRYGCMLHAAAALIAHANVCGVLCYVCVYIRKCTSRTIIMKWKLQIIYAFYANARRAICDIIIGLVRSSVVVLF